MFYSEQLQSPINSYNVKRLYGVNPDNDPSRAAAIGILPLTEVPQGYGVSHYVKEGKQYEAIPYPVSNAELEMVDVIRTAQVGIEQLRVALNVPEPTPEPEPTPAPTPEPTPVPEPTPSPVAVNGYYPLYTSEADANAAGDGTSHSHIFDGVTYYMPNGVTYYHGDYGSSGY